MRKTNSKTILSKVVTLTAIVAVLASPAQAMSKPMKMFIGSVLVLGGAYLTYDGARLIETQKTSHSTETESNTTSSTWPGWSGGSNYQEITTETVTQTVLVEKVTTLNNKNLIYMGILGVALGSAVFAFVEAGPVRFKIDTTGIVASVKF